MAYKVVVLPQAEADIREAFGYLEERAPEVATRWYSLIRAALESLSAMPARCPLAPETSLLGLELRQLLYGQRPSIYRIVFRILEDVREVHVLTVRHGARKPLSEEDLEPFLGIP